jgi:cytochrome c oxidase subunit IV
METTHTPQGTPADAQSQPNVAEEHPVGIYLKIWFLLFVLSTCSFLVDYFDFQGLVRWALIIIFMLLKAGFIVAIFMHVMWERMALITLILGPPTVLLVLVGLMSSESNYMFDTRVEHLGQPEAAVRIHVGEVAGEEH